MSNLLEWSVFLQFGVVEVDFQIKMKVAESNYNRK